MKRKIDKGKNTLKFVVVLITTVALLSLQRLSLENKQLKAVVDSTLKEGANNCTAKSSSNNDRDISNIDGQDPKREKKYFLSAVTILKNEADIIEEWIDHHRKQGVEHFYLIDNGSSDDLHEKLTNYFGNIVTLYADTRKHQQLQILNHHIDEVKSNSEWVLQIDLDEFVYARPSAGWGNTIASVLKEIPSWHQYDLPQPTSAGWGETMVSMLRKIPFRREPDLPEINAITLQWTMFGSSGHIEQPPSVRMNFTRCNKGLDPLSKYLIRSDTWFDVQVHEPRVSAGRVSNQCLNPFYTCGYDDAVLILNHYAIMAKDRFAKVKMTRGDVADGIYETVRDENYFNKYDANGNASECTELANMAIASLE